MKKYVPRSYQSFIQEMAVSLPAIGMFLDMGLGKTIISLGAILELALDTFEVSRVLVIAPMRAARRTWTQEPKKWGHTKHLRVSQVIGSKKKRLAALEVNADYYVMNVENTKWLCELYGKDWPFDMVILDELSLFKNPRSGRFKALKKVRPLIKHVLGLTGTPAPNGLLDLWSQVYLLDRGERLGKTFAEYKERYFRCIVKMYSGYPVSTYELIPGAEKKIYKKIGDICFSLDGDDYLELPERIDNYIMVQLDKKSRKRYDYFEKNLLLQYAEGDLVASNAGALNTKLLQMASGAVYNEHGDIQHIHDEKLEELAEIVDAANGKPMLVLYWFKHELPRILERFPQARELSDDDSIDAWERGEVQVAAAHPAKIGHGLNIQAGGSIIVWYSLTWSLELYIQVIKRLLRDGQKDPTVVINHLIAEGTVDENVMSALQRKHVTQGDLLRALRARIKFVKRSLK